MIAIDEEDLTTIYLTRGDKVSIENFRKENLKN